MDKQDDFEVVKQRRELGNETIDGREHRMTRLWVIYDEPGLVPETLEDSFFPSTLNSYLVLDDQSLTRYKWRST